MARTQFYALSEDLIPVFARVEEEHPIVYTLSGLFESPNAVAFPNGVLLPSLRAASPASSALCATYLVTLAGTQVHVRSVPQRTGGIKFAVDQLANPDSVMLRHGGIHSRVVVVSGQVATVSRSPAAKTLQSSFSRCVGKFFTRVNSFYVGPRAFELLQQGARLTHSASAPAEYNLALHGA